MSITLCLTGWGAIAAPNDFQVQVVDSVPGIKVGDQLDRTVTVKIPANGRMTLIDRTGSTVRTRECAGPHDGKIDACPPPPLRNSRTLPPGGTRGFTPSPEASDTTPKR